MGYLWLYDTGREVKTALAYDTFAVHQSNQVDWSHFLQVPYPTLTWSLSASLLYCGPKLALSPLFSGVPAQG